MNKRPEQTEQTKERIREAFWTLYTDSPIEKVSVSRVCELAGFNRGTFYLHFTDIYEVLEQVESRLLDDLNACVERCMESLEQGADPEAAMRDVLDFYEANSHYIVVLLGPHGDPAFTPKLKERLKPLWRKYVLKRKDGESASETDLVLEYTLSGALFMVSRWLANPNGVSAEKMLHLIYHSVLER